MGIVARGWGEVNVVQRSVHCRGLPPVYRTNLRAPGVKVHRGFVSHTKHIGKVPNSTNISL